MENIDLIIREIENEQRKIIEEKAHLIIDEITLLFNNIKNSNSIDEAHQYFNSLEKIQSALAKAFFKERLDLGNSLWKFVKDFDRIDDSELRKYLFEQIKIDKYSLKIK